MPVWNAILEPFERMLVHFHKRRNKVFISDTTLRDGEQMPGARLGVADKLAIARALGRAGVDSIDAGFPAAAPEEITAIQAIVREVRGPVITALCRTVPGDIDRAAEALQEGSTYKKGITLFIGTSPQHRVHKHRQTKAGIIRTAVDSVLYARGQLRMVAVGPEDASRTEPDYLCEFYREVIAAGASTIGFPDTVGILTPRKAADWIKRIQDEVPNIADALLAVHFHNDLGLATANALACVLEGANVVQGTINGIGERAGNTALEEVVMVFSLHGDEYGRRCRVDPRQLSELSSLVGRLTGAGVPPNKAVVGRNLFFTESGIHQAGLLRDLSTYLPFQPEAVGAGPVRLALGKHSGRHAVRHCLGQRRPDMSDEDVDNVLTYLKGTPQRNLYVTEEELDELVAEVFGPPQERKVPAQTILEN